MKKTTFGAVLAFLFAAAGALTAAALYLYHREKELDEYERLLFSDDYEDDDYDDSPSEPPAPKEEIDALFDEIRASCVGPVKPQNPNPRNHFYRKSR